MQSAMNAGLSPRGVQRPGVETPEDVNGKSRGEPPARLSGAACAKRGASGRMQRPAELVPIRYGA